MTVAALPRTGWLNEARSFLLFFALEIAAFAIVPLSAVQGWMRYLLPAHAALTAAFLLLALVAGKGKVMSGYSSILYALFAAGAAILVSTLWHMDLTRAFGFTNETPQGFSVAIFFQSLMRAAAAITVMKLAGASWQSMYLRKGNLKLSLGVGIPAFLVLAAAAFAMQSFERAATFLLPWILLFVLSNGFAEELLYRGLLLQRYEPFLGKGPANLLAAAVFTYAPSILPFLLGTFVLALAWGYLMQKSGTLWGSALFHAGADCVIIFGVFASI